MILPLKSGSADLSTAYIDALRRVWPTKDIDTELAKIMVWLTDNPKRRPAHFPRFLKSWLSHASDVIAPAPRVAAWWATEQRTLNQGAALGLAARPGESIADYRERISSRLGAK